MKKGPFKMKGFGGFGNSPVKKIDLKETIENVKKGVKKGAASNAGQEIIGHLGKRLIDRILPVR